MIYCLVTPYFSTIFLSNYYYSMQIGVLILFVLFVLVATYCHFIRFRQHVIYDMSELNILVFYFGNFMRLAAFFNKLQMHHKYCR